MNEQFDRILSILHGIWRNRRWVLLVAWLVFPLGILVVYMMPDQYQAKTVIYVDTKSVLKPLLRGLAVDTDEVDEIRIVTRMLLNRENLERLIRETDMDIDSATPAERERMLERLRNTITISGGGGGRRRGPQDNLYTISYQDRSPQRSYRVVSALMNIFIETALSATRTDTTGAQRFLDEQIRAYEARLRESEQRLAEFKKENVGRMPGERGGYYAQIQAAMDEMEELGSALKLAINRRDELRKQLRGEKPIIGVEQFQGPNARVTRLREYQDQLLDLLTRFTDQHPEVMALKAKIAQLEAGENPGDATLEAPDVAAGDSSELNPVYQELKVELSKAEVEITTLRIQLTERQKKVAELRKLVDTIPQIEAQLARLNRDYEVTKGRYIELVERRESARLSQLAEQDANETKFQVINPPVVPLKPAAPNRPLLLTAALAAAVGAGVGLVFLLLQIRPTFDSPKDLRRKTGLPVLGVVSLKRMPRERVWLRARSAAFAVSVMVLVGVYGGALIYAEAGSARLQSVVTKDRLHELLDGLQL